MRGSAKARRPSFFKGFYERGMRLNLYKNQRGSASVLAIFMIICMFAVGAFSIDIARLFCVKVAVKHRLNLACRSAATQLDEEELKNAGLVIDGARAAQAFCHILKVNLVLNDALIPQPGSILDAGPVLIEYFKVVNPGDVPFKYTRGGYTETVSRTAVVAIISFPVESGMFTQLIGGPRETTMYCHVTVAPELINKPAGQI